MRSLGIYVVGARQGEWPRLRSLLEVQAGWRVTGFSETGERAVSDYAPAMMDVVVSRMGSTAAQGTAQTDLVLSELASRARFLIVSGDPDEVSIRRALRAGAQGYLLEAEFERKIRKAIKEVVQGRRFLSARVARIVLHRFLNASSGSELRTPENIPLTPREVEIVRCITRGSGNKQVAAELGIAIRTAETHRANIMRKLNLRNLAELIRFAISWGIAGPETPRDAGVSLIEKL